jgi:hypothetical protein
LLSGEYDCSGADGYSRTEGGEVGDDCSGSDLTAGADGDVSTDGGSWSDGDEVADLRACDEDVSVYVAVSPYTGFRADGGVCAYYGSRVGLCGVVEGCCGMYGARCFGWDVHLFSDSAVVVADEVFVEELGVDTGSEDVGAVDMVVQIADKVLAGRSEDVGDVLPMTPST